MVIPKTTPRPYQASELAANGSKSAWGIFWEPGLGKSKLLIDTFAELEDAGEVDALFVLAPNGVHYNWVRKELPRHLPMDAKVMLWQTKKAKNLGHKDWAQVVLEHEGPSVLSMSYDALMTDAGQKYAKAFLDGRSCLYAFDESHWLKSPGAKRTIRASASAKRAPYLRLSTGTLVADSPFDVFSQLKLLKPDVWDKIGCRSSEAFKATFGVWEKSYGRDREYPVLVRYRNLDLLHEIVDSMGSRLVAEDAGLVLPPKRYEKRYFDLTPEQRRHYEDLRKEFSTLFAGDYVDAPLAITRLLRLQQVTSGFLPSEDPERDDVKLAPIGSQNLRVELMLDIVRERPGEQGIIWAKYRQDITLILAALRGVGVTAVRYDGLTKDLPGALEDFWTGHAQMFVSNPAKGGEGLTLNEAQYMIWYNNSHKLIHRTQGAKRNDRIGQEADELVHYDLIARGTVDELIVDTLRSKATWAAVVQGDKIKEWI